MSRRHLLAVALLVLVTLAGCVDRSVKREAITEYLNAGWEDRGIGCPFPVHEAAVEGIAGVSGAHGFAVGADATVHVAFADRLETRTPDWEEGQARDLDGSAQATRIAAGPDVVAVARARDGNWTLSTTTPALDPIAERTLGPDLGGLAVDADGTVLAVDDPDPAGDEIVRLSRNLSQLERIDLEGIDARVLDLGTCGDRLHAVTEAEGSGRVDVFESDGRRTARDRLRPADDVGVGHDLVVASSVDGDRRSLDVWTVEGTHLLNLNNSRGRAYGSFEVAHGMVYNLRQDALLARPIPDFLTRPS